MTGNEPSDTNAGGDHERDTTSQAQHTQAALKASDWATLLAGTALLVVANGRWTVAVAAWLAPILLLRFARRANTAVGAIALYAAIAGASVIMWWGLPPLRGLAYFGFIGALSLLTAAPFLLDAWLTRRWSPFVSNLLLPLFWVSIEFLLSLFSPFCTWGSIAYSQGGNLSLLQLLLVTGIWGITFLIGWVAAVTNWAWQRRWDWQAVRHGVVVCGASVAIIVTAGQLRMALLPPEGSSLRAASITIQPQEASRIWRTLRHTPPPPEELREIRAETARLHDRLIAASEREARAGARWVVWSEINGLVFKEDEEALIARGQELARRHGIYLAMALGVFTLGQPVMDNRLVTLDPQGQIASSYFKATRVPGDRQSPGDRELPVMTTPYGRIAAALCYDMDFPRLLRRRPGSHADIVIAPSKDWYAIRDIHATMAIYRGIENGMSVLRQTYQGVSVAVDYQGRVLARVDDYQSPEPALVAYLPVQGVRTIYSMTGDVLGWLSLAMSGVLVAAAVRRNRNEPVGVRPRPFFSVSSSIG